MLKIKISEQTNTPISYHSINTACNEIGKVLDDILVNTISKSKIGQLDVKRTIPQLKLNNNLFVTKLYEFATKYMNEELPFVYNGKFFEKTNSTRGNRRRF